jgi:energy-coupling factor transporter ATP-binding protein EcfA2
LFPHLGQPDNLGTALAGFFKGAAAPSGLSDREERDYLDQLDLAFDLLVTVGRIDVSAFKELQSALRNEDEGLANGIVSSMNEQLAKSLNLSRWWTQDHRFSVAIAIRDYDIVFTVRDRTGSEYSFAERSGGLKYFLSYLVQFLAHISARSGPELLLMDEPDAFLSNQGQQDLLKVFHEFTRPYGDCPAGQVVFVTHSPFLIDKNRADRIRVLDKGSGDEGARVVRDVGHNHFEPLRTALGGFVGETAFIGNCNLMLEGMTDQVYLAGMSALLKREGAASTECLDLNQLTLVPAGSASHVPYMTYLARGRDADQPAVIVLLDGDKEGDAAVKTLKRGGPRNRQLIRPEYVTQLKHGAVAGVDSDRPGGPFDIEDLVPVEVGLAAARRYLEEMEMEIPASFPDASTVRAKLSGSVGILDAVQKATSAASIDMTLEKLGFARHVLTALENDDLGEPAELMRKRFVALFSHLTTLQRRAERERSRESIAARVDRERSLFLRDHRGTPSKADVVVLLERIEAVVDESVEGDALLTEIRRIREDFDLHRDLGDDVPRYSDLADRLETLQYAEVLASQPDETEE